MYYSIYRSQHRLIIFNITAAIYTIGGYIATTVILYTTAELSHLHFAVSVEYPLHNALEVFALQYIIPICWADIFSLFSLYGGYI
jgi:hypothetical protein